IFDGVMQEEARHILFFCNWAAYRGVQLPLVQKPWFFVRRACGVALQALGRGRTALQLRDGETTGDDFTMQIPDRIGAVPLTSLARTCIRANGLRLAPSGPGLLRPRMVPSLVGLALRFVPGDATRA